MPSKKKSDDIEIKPVGGKKKESIFLSADLKKVKCPNTHEVTIETGRGNEYIVRKWNQDVLDVNFTKGVCNLRINGTPVGEIRSSGNKVYIKLWDKNHKLKKLEPTPGREHHFAWEYSRVKEKPKK